MSAPTLPASESIPSESGKGYQRYALLLLMIIYALNMLDRQIVNILAEPLKKDLNLADWQVGAVTGLAFAVFYTGLGLPIARLADRSDRVWLISGSLAIWSAFTVLCAFVRDFPQLVLARLGVGFGEAGCTPAAHSLIAESTPRNKLASALAFYSLGIPIGSLLGLAMGGIIADVFGWRAAFIVAGAPGLLVAAIAFTTLREPRRRAKAAQGARKSQISLRLALGELVRKPAFWWISFATGFGSLVFYSQTAFLGSLFMRAHSDEIGELSQTMGMGPSAFLGLALGLLLGLGSGFGTFAGGQIADRASRRSIKGYVMVPLAGMLISTPFFIALNLVDSAVIALACIVPATFAHALAYGSVYAAVQSLTSPGVRATAAAVNLFISTIIGLGFGPLAVGALSDVFAAQHGNTAGLQLAMAWSVAFLLVAAGCFYIAGRTVRNDAHGAMPAPDANAAAQGA